jgi:hypothetical protein
MTSTTMPFNTFDMYNIMTDFVDRKRKSAFPLGWRFAGTFWARQKDGVFEFRISRISHAEHKALTEERIANIPPVATLTEEEFCFSEQIVIDYFSRNYPTYHYRPDSSRYLTDRLLYALAGIRVTNRAYKGITRYAFTRAYMPFLYLRSFNFSIRHDQFTGFYLSGTGLDAEITERVKAAITPHKKAIQALIKMDAVPMIDTIPTRLGLEELEEYAHDPISLIQAAMAYTHVGWGRQPDRLIAAKRAISLPFWYKIFCAYTVREECA